MPRIVNAWRLHELYGTTSRRRHFPDAHWLHLVLAARNLSAAFQAMHSHGIVIGDVNQGNLLVDAQMCVRFIDCDSLQVRTSQRVFNCPVGTPHFTPPELQAQRLVEVERTPNHDGFGLAVLIFHLLFVGRHPFAGRFRSSAEVTIEKAISQRLFAFSKRLIGTQVDPPVASLTTDDIPSGLAALFERAFCGGRNQGDLRPTAREWCDELDKLIKARKACSLDPKHVYYNQVQDCPWCRIETQGGPSHFQATSKATTSIKERRQELDDTLQKLFMTPFPEISATRVEIPVIPTRVSRDPTRRAGYVDLAAAGLVVGSAICLVGFMSLIALSAGSVLAISSAAYLFYNPTSRRRRNAWRQQVRELSGLEKQLQQLVRSMFHDLTKLRQRYEDATSELTKKRGYLDAQGEELDELIRMFESEGRDAQRNDFLRKFPLRDQVGAVLGLTKEHVRMLEMYGIETACEAEMHMLYNIPNITNGLAMELDNWRSTVQKQFVFRSDFGTSVKDLKQHREEAIQNFHHAQAQRVLIAAKEVKGKMITARDVLAKALTKFDRLVTKWRNSEEVHRRLRRGQGYLEAMTNRSRISLAAWGIGVPAVAWALYVLLA